ncbi:MAG: large-conductance mechanosensitive channel protein MscL [Ignavibacteria bacterium]|jgi:large conductance mechanosensitive channel|nr:large-conductance mechanosensitive channel protein MscL [Ignavibacteria bacterium]MDH7526821.1 large-conductance mechanosensitive channel protein MscL [Ignavibacteria bacterium]NPV11658.1 large-conductance mechanosensitive channel protein MscL [Ignavibacteria bacterium]
MLDEFKKFALKGNMIDMAVGIILGAAFGSVVNSLVNDIIMPPLGFLIGGVDFKDLFITIKGGPVSSLEEARKVGAVVWAYGNFITTLINFLIIAFALFLVVKSINTMREKLEKKESKTN